MSDKNEVVEVEPKPYQYYEQVFVQKIHHFYISQVIEEPGYYIDMIHRIRTAPADEIIYIHLNTAGGNLATGVQIVNAMKATEAHVVCSLESRSHSLGTLIFLAADEFVVHDDCIMMFHNYSGGTYGKGHEQVAEVDATNKWFNILAKKLYVPFMSEEEFTDIIKGGDLWLHSDEIRERLTKMVQILEKEQKEQEIQIPTKKKTSRKKTSKKKASRKST